MKKRNVYFLSALITLAIFFICASLNGYIPLGKNIFNISDAFNQYPGILMEYKNLFNLKNLFFSWNAGLGFNFLGTITYYSLSPLNLLCFLSNVNNYAYFSMILIYIRLVLASLTMCFYLDKRGTKSSYTILFSVIYALMGFTSTYYYNYMWIDSIIMLPLVIHGIDKLIETKKQTFYIVALSFSIIFNYYIGYMICIFSLIYFIYRVLRVPEKKELITKFIISSLLAGTMCAVVIVPSYFALTTGKSELFKAINYGGISRNAFTFFYTLTSGSYLDGDYKYGPAQVYTTLFVIALTVYYFFNNKISKKEKVSTFVVLAILYLSIAINALNFAWQFFQRPVWWNSRFSFVISFFLIITALKSLESIDSVKIDKKKKIIVPILFTILLVVGLYFKSRVSASIKLDTYIYLILSLVAFTSMICLLDKKKLLPLLLVITFMDLSLNTFNNLKQNNYGINVNEHNEFKKDVLKDLQIVKKENDFFRFELAKKYTFNDGLYFNYHGLNYFNSVKNFKVMQMLTRMGLSTPFNANITIEKFDPIFLSLFNVKYLYSENEIPYFKKMNTNLYENIYPLAIAYTVNPKIKTLKLEDVRYTENLEKLINTLVNEKFEIYDRIENIESDEYEFKGKDNYLFIPNDSIEEIIINDEKIELNGIYREIKKDDIVKVQFNKKEQNKYIELFNYDKYKNAIENLQNEKVETKTYIGNHILEATIDVKKDNSYLFTTIPYEKGMNIMVDGKEITPDTIFDALIGISLNKGKHKITIDYVPKGLKEGAIISSISLIATLAYLVITRKIKR